ncbi:hypothetical protein NL676_037718 [Syzygium grande]|nr:hypothetical protein NL676_037718 [Syzygium grande]
MDTTHPSLSLSTHLLHLALPPAAAAAAALSFLFLYIAPLPPSLSLLQRTPSPPFLPSAAVLALQPCPRCCRDHDLSPSFPSSSIRFERAAG